MMKHFRWVAIAMLFGCLSILGRAGERQTRNVFLVMTDGLRWQEVFTGAEDPAALKAKKGDEAMVAAYRQATPRARRAALLPFLWGTVARRGQLFGNRAAGCPVDVTNGFKFSYPGFSETLTGHADPRVNSNDPIFNPNVTVLEWLNRKPAFKGKVAAFGAWDRFEHIINAPRCGFLVNAGYEPLQVGRANEKIALLNQLKQDLPRMWNSEPFDAITYHTALEYLKENKPRVLFLAFGETDEWAHANDYGQYLAAAHRWDAAVRELWETAQSMPEYKDCTTMILMTDHGRGVGERWTGHGKDVPNAECIWLGVLGPDTPALGERHEHGAVTQNQVAATLAALLGEDYNAGNPQAGKPVAGVTAGGTR